MIECNSALSAYLPAQAAAPALIPASTSFELPLQVYIIETIERRARSRRLRQLGAIAVLVAGIFVSQWPAAYSSANAVPTGPASTQQAGASEIAPEMLNRLAFAPSLPVTRNK